MNITELIELLTEEKRITPHAEVRVRCKIGITGDDDAGDQDIVECDNNGQEVILITEV